ncbi:hypothetical protein [Brucella pituitosa]|uniref:Uncharacterized protein n=1 Tax=Brucella pituitosa TaxID=571256 RepID=A0ABS3K8L0_9HYPH|nr:hypothetical protein [Brucella pituitosa]MBO1042393.1 hypothetical protein [Brucella pituitosa]
MPKTKSNPITFGTCLAEFKDSRFPRDYAGRGLVVVEDNSNDAEGHVAKMLERVGDEAKTYGYHFPIRRIHHSGLPSLMKPPIGRTSSFMTVIASLCITANSMMPGLAVNCPAS